MMEESMTSGRSVRLWISGTAWRISSASSASGAPMFTSSSMAPPVTCSLTSISTRDRSPWRSCSRKIFQLQLRQGDLSRVEIDVKEQVTGGAMLLDVNMGAPLADEAELMRQAVPLIQSLTDLPLVIDSSIIEVLDAGLAAYQGKALVNSVTAEDERMEAILPIVKKYGAAVIGLPNDEEEIPEEPARRVELVRKLIHVATEKYKIPVEDIVIDPLAMPVGADTLHPTRTIDTIAMIKAEFGVNMTL